MPADLLLADPIRDGAGIFSDWQRFIQNGCRAEDFTPLLHSHLVWYCNYNLNLDREAFWRYYFDSDLGRLKKFLNHFGGDHTSPETGRVGLWLDEGWTEAAGLNRRLCAAMETLYPAFLAVLDELAGALYEAEKWNILAGHTAGLTPERLCHWSAAYEADIPFSEAADYLQTTPQVRRWLALAAARLLGADREPETRPVPPALSGRRPASLFEVRAALATSPADAGAEADAPAPLDWGRAARIARLTGPSDHSGPINCQWQMADNKGRMTHEK